VVPPNTGICHQVNLEYLARVVFTKDGRAYPDTLVGTDSHTTMINGLGVLGWGVGGIEAEAAMLGQPISMLIPQVVGFKFTGELLTLHPEQHPPVLLDDQLQMLDLERVGATLPDQQRLQGFLVERIQIRQRRFGHAPSMASNAVDNMANHRMNTGDY